MGLEAPEFKNLIYFTLGNNPDYLILTKLCIDSLVKVGYTGDLLFITDMKIGVLDTIKYDGKILFMNVPPSDNIGSSSNKLKVYQYENIQQYYKIICCDLDILWIKSPNLIFDIMVKNKFYFADDDFTHLLMSTHHDFYGNTLLTNDERILIEAEQIKGVSAGFFSFNVELLKELEIIDEICSNLGYQFPAAEQPIINTYLWRNKLYTNDLNGLITHQGYFNDSLDYVLVHFAGGVGNFETKFTKMKNHPLWN
jgi:hypothetical protein